MPRLRLLLALALLVVTPALFAQESVTLTVPMVKTATNCTLEEMIFGVTARRIVATLACPNGDTITKQYDAFSTPTGSTLLSNLNRGNFSGATSLVRFVYNRLILDGVIAGTVTGTAQ